MSFVCFLCETKCQTIDGLEYHLKLQHKKTVNSRHSCKQDQCSRDFISWRYLKRHILNDHKEVLNRKRRVEETVNALEGTPESSTAVLAHGLPSTSFTDVNVETDNGASNSAPSVDASVDLLGCAKDQMCHFAAKLYCVKKLPRNVVQTVIKESSTLVQTVIQACAQASPEELAAMSATDVFQDFRSEHTRLKYLREAGVLLDPYSQKVGDVEKTCRRMGQVTVSNVDANFQMIPLRAVLKEFLELPGVLDKIDEYVNALESCDSLENFMQGSLWARKKASIPKTSQTDLDLPIDLYYDGIQVNNTLSGHAKTLGAIYYNLPFLPPVYRSSLENIFVGAIFENEDKNAFGFHNVVKPCVDTFLELQSEGIVVKTDKGSRRVRFCLGCILGDNLGVSEILGFMGASANYYCRMCKARKQQCQFMLREDKSLLRNEENFLEDLRKLPSEGGIKENVQFNKIPGYHVTDNCSVDILHDFLEGICSYDMNAILHNLVIERKIVSYETLIFRLRTFNYYQNGLRNEPPSIPLDHIKNKHIRLSGSEMLTFVRLFALLVGDVVPEGDPVWELYLLLRRILDIILAPSLHPNISEILEETIALHHETYLKVFPNETLKPKFHNAIHYPRLLRQVGPLINLSCIRLEAKHRDLTAVAKSTESRKNICYTLALRQQLFFAERLLSRRGLKDNLEIPVVDPCDVTKMDDFESFGHLILNRISETCYAPSWVDFNGTHYKIGMCVAFRDFRLPTQPLFATIKHILVFENESVMFVCDTFEITYFNEHLHGYEVQKSNEWICSKVQDLLSYNPVIIATLPAGPVIVTLKFAL